MERGWMKRDSRKRGQPNGQWYLQYALQKFDGITGQPYPADNLGGILWTDINSWYAGIGYNTVTTYPPMVVHTDGTISVAYNQTPAGSLVGTPGGCDRPADWPVEKYVLRR
jgi:hypothetical protein